MPIPTRLNCHTFFNYWAFKAFDKHSTAHLSKKDRVIAQIACVIFGACTFGLGIGICKACSNGRFHRKLTDYGRVQRIYNRGRPQVKSKDFLDALQSSYEKEGFCKFRRAYKEMKTIMTREGLSNPFYWPSITKIDHPFYEKVKDLALASDVLDALAKDPVERDSLLGKMEYKMDFTSPQFLKEVANHCHVKDMPFLFSYDFGNKLRELRTTPLTLLTQWIHHPNQAKWEAALPFLWEKTFQFTVWEVVSADIYRSNMVALIKSLITQEKFQVTFESLMAFKNEVNTGLPRILTCKKSDGLSVQKRIEIVKNCLWDNCLISLKNPHSLTLRKNVVRHFINSPFNLPLFTSIHLSLSSIPKKEQDCRQQFFGEPSDLTLLTDDLLEQFLKDFNVKTWTTLCLVSKGHYQRFLDVIRKILPSCINEILEQQAPISLESFTLKELLELRNSVEILVFQKAVKQLIDTQNRPQGL